MKYVAGRMGSSSCSHELESLLSKNDKYKYKYEESDNAVIITTILMIIQDNKVEAKESAEPNNNVSSTVSQLPEEVSVSAANVSSNL